MLNISEIVKKTEEMFDLFNQHFYSNELTRLAGSIFFTLSTVSMTITIGICILPFKFLNYSIEFYLYIFFLFFCCRIQFL